MPYTPRPQTLRTPRNADFAAAIAPPDGDRMANEPLFPLECDKLKDHSSFDVLVPSP